MQIKKSNAHKPIARSVFIGVLTYILICTLILMGITPEQHDVQVGSPAPMNIIATKEVNDVVTTEAQREAAAAAVEPSYKSVDPTVLSEVTSAINAIFDAIEAERTNGTAMDDETARGKLNERFETEFTAEQFAAVLTCSDQELSDLQSALLSAVRDTMNSTLPEGQESAAITRIARILAGSGNSTALVSLSTEVLRKCLRANMLIDEEITEANRQKARDAVEMKTCVKGEMIVREGEIVTQAQYMMVAALGLLKEDHIDMLLIVGVALTILLILLCLALYFYHCDKELLQPGKLTLMALIFVLVIAFALVTSSINVYLMPVSLGLMLIALLVDARLALFVNMALSLLISLLTNTGSGLFGMAMYTITIMALIDGPIVVIVYTRNQQRTGTLAAGLLVAIANFLATFAIGMISTAEVSASAIKALWAALSALLSTVLCIGLQPIMEMIFNLPTTAKLIELSNPNRPLLRRLLIEAPGTYHHSIIVANLAEAAASAIGANGVLARVGAYYHDVGKLKRPLYFKENQMGDNPHDRTDPRVSAAILTSHPRDGFQLAQKEKLPQEILDIIQQHHGDSVTLYFYDRAMKLYGDSIDVSSFRYDGPRPQSKEAAVVMLADTIEAAVRSVADPTPEKIDELIRKLVRSKMSDGQLDECDISFMDLDRICKAFSTVMNGAFHERIVYPDVTPPPRSESKTEEKA